MPVAHFHRPCVAAETRAQDLECTLLRRPQQVGSDPTGNLVGCAGNEPLLVVGEVVTNKARAARLDELEVATDLLTSELIRQAAQPARSVGEIAKSRGRPST
jgi:hypothetical protein